MLGNLINVSLTGFRYNVPEVVLGCDMSQSWVCMCVCVAKRDVDCVKSVVIVDWFIVIDVSEKRIFSTRIPVIQIV
jgi:hypothetical protein